MNPNQMVALSMLAIATTTGVSAWLSVAGRTNDLTPFSQGSGVTQSQINRLRWYATSKTCTPEGCMLTVDQSAGAILSLLGGASQFDGERDIYPILDSDDGVSEPTKLVVYFHSDGESPARAYQIEIPVFNRAARYRPRTEPISGNLQTPAPPPVAPAPPPTAESILPPGMDQDAYQRLRTAGSTRTNAFAEWGSN